LDRDRKWLGPLFAGIDLLSAEAAFITAVLLRYGYFHPIPPFFNQYSYWFYAGLLVVLYLPVLLGFGVHRRRHPAVKEFLQSVFLLSVLVNILPFYFRSFAFSRFVFLSFCVLVLFYGLAWRLVAQFVLAGSWSFLLSERALLVASAGRLPGLVETLKETAGERLEIVALAAEGSGNLGKDELPLKVQGSFDEVPRLAEEFGVDVVLLEPEGIAPKRWLTLAESLASRGVSIRLVSGVTSELGLQLQQDILDEAAQLGLIVKPIRGVQALLKRAIDIGVSLLVLILSAPLMCLIAVAIKLSSPGPVIYKQERVGRNGVVFPVYKFRSMIHGAERNTGPVWSGTDDERIIPGIGHFLRRTGLDELPQFWNVLTGRMSLVGPRPERAYFFDSYPELYRGRLAVRPGLTGLAQVSCRNTTSVSRKVRHDLYYIRNYSLALDVEILWRTLAMLLRQEARAIFGRHRTEKPEKSAVGGEKPGKQKEK